MRARKCAETSAKYARTVTETGFFVIEGNFWQAEGGGRVTKQQKKAVRKALRQCGRRLRAAGADIERTDTLCGPWETVIWQVLDYYAGTDETCAELLMLRSGLGAPDDT